MWSNNYLKVPFKEKGRDETGCDCWGLVYLIAKTERGLILPKFESYNDSTDAENIAELIRTNTASKDWISITEGEEKPFDVCVFKMVGLSTHVGIVVKRGLMIHSQRGSATTHASYVEAEWARRLTGIYRYAGSNSEITI